MIRLTRRAALALPALAALAGCGGRAGSTLERMRGDGVARIGITGERPFGYVDADGTVTGSSPTVVRAVLAALGVGGVEAVQVPFAQLFDGLLAGQFDVVAAGTTVTRARCARVAFSRPDFLAPVAFLVRSGNPYGIRTFDGVRRAGVRLGVVAGAVERDYALAAGVRPDRLVDHADQGALLRSVRDGEVPVGTLSRLSLLEVLDHNPGSGLEVTPGVAAAVDAAGRRVLPTAAFAFRPADGELVAAFDPALARLRASGEWLRLTRPFGFTEENVPTADARSC